MPRIIGLEKFRDYFSDYKSFYVLIGGSACSILMDDANLEFRATKDLDLVLCAETLSRDFIDQFWKFLKLGGYTIAQKSSGKKCFYRFTKPSDKSYPYMLEILSDKADIFEDVEIGGIVPLTIEDEIVSLSAILLNADYYQFIMSLNIILEGITLADQHVIIPLKARAFLDLSERKDHGENIRSTDIKKHKNDIYRLSQLLTNKALTNIPEIVKEDIKAFVDKVEDEDAILKQLDIVGLTILDIKKQLITVYCNGDFSLLKSNAFLD